MQIGLQHIKHLTQTLNIMMSKDAMTIISVHKH